MDERRRIPITDKRRRDDAAKVAEDTPGVTAREGGPQVLMDETSAEEQQPLSAAYAPGDPRLSVEELQRLKADLENDRKRMIREQSRALEYATKDLIKRLLPAIDHFNLAVEHGEGGSGVELALKELVDVLATEGFEEIPVAVGDPFDPQVHHALATQPDASVETEKIAQVHRPGYRFKDHILRSPEVVVAQPVADGEAHD